MEFNEATTKKAQALYEFIYDATHISYHIFNIKYPEYTKWHTEQDAKDSYTPIQNRPGIIDYIAENFFEKF
jgi:hypothetical protein